MKQFIEFLKSYLENFTKKWLLLRGGMCWHGLGNQVGLIWSFLSFKCLAVFTHVKQDWLTSVSKLLQVLVLDRGLLLIVKNTLIIRIIEIMKIAKH